MLEYPARVKLYESRSWMAPGAAFCICFVPGSGTDHNKNFSNVISKSPYIFIVIGDEKGIIAGAASSSK